MLDTWLETLMEKESEDAQVEQLAAAMQALPVSALSNIIKEGCMHGGHGAEKLEKYMGTPLFDQAVALEQNRLQLDQHELQVREQERAQRDSNSFSAMHDQIRTQREQLQLQQAILDIQLLQTQNSEMQGDLPPPNAAPPVPEAAPVEAAPVPAASEVPPEAVVPAPPAKTASLRGPVIDAQFRLLDAQGRSLAHMHKEAISLGGLVGGLGRGLGTLVGGAKGVGGAFANVGRGVGQLAQRGASRAAGAARTGGQAASGLGRQFSQQFAAGSAGAQKAIGGGRQLAGTTARPSQENMAALNKAFPSLGHSPVPAAAPPAAPVPASLPPPPAASGGFTPLAPTPIAPGGGQEGGNLLHTLSNAANVAGMAAPMVAGSRQAPQQAQQVAGQAANYNMPKAAQDMDAVGRLLAKTATKIPVGEMLGTLARRNVPAMVGAGVGAVGGGLAGAHEGGATGAIGGALGGAALGAGAGKALQVGRIAKSLHGRGFDPGEAVRAAARGVGQRDLRALGVRGADVEKYIPSPSTPRNPRVKATVTGVEHGSGGMSDDAIRMLASRLTPTTRQLPA